MTMISLPPKEIRNIIPKVNKGLHQYLYIQEFFRKINVSKDLDFQKKFNVFYRVVPFRDKNWQKKFYNLLQKGKKGNLDFRKVLSELYKQTNNLEASFASKIMATINPKLPVIDSIVLRNIREMGNNEIKLPHTKAINRLDKIVELHKNLEKLFNDFLKTSNGKYLVKEFNKMYPRAKITKQKILDLVIWQKR